MKTGVSEVFLSSVSHLFSRFHFSFLFLILIFVAEICYSIFLNEVSALCETVSSNGFLS